jgi:hypothetical protein
MSFLSLDEAAMATIKQTISLDVNPLHGVTLIE